MAIVKFITSGCPMNNIFPYVTRDEATEQRLISGIYCFPDTALEESAISSKSTAKRTAEATITLCNPFHPMIT